MDRNREKPLAVLVNPFSFWTDLALTMWGFRRPEPHVSEAPARERVAVAVIPAGDAPAKRRVKKPKAARAKPRRSVAPAKRKSKAKRARGSRGRTLR
jgi:hypothetical protein